MVIYEEIEPYINKTSIDSDNYRRLRTLERENRELRGEVLALRHGIQKVTDECQRMLQGG